MKEEERVPVNCLEQNDGSKVLFIGIYSKLFYSHYSVIEISTLISDFTAISLLQFLFIV